MRVFRTPGLFLLVISVITVFFEIHTCFTINDSYRIMTDFPEHPDEYIHCKNRDIKARHGN